MVLDGSRWYGQGLAETLFETARVIVLVLDLEGRIVRFNPYLEEIAGYALQEVQGRDWFSIFIPKEERIGEVMARAQAGMETNAVRCPLVTKDGSRREIEWHNSPLRACGQVTGVLSIGQDVTERACLERELRQRQKMDAIGRLVGGIAHDFNNLLMGISGCAQIALEALAEPDRARELIQELHDAAVRGAGLPRQLLAFASERAAPRAIVSLNEVISETEQMLCRCLGEELDVQLDLCTDDTRVKADRAQLDQILLNLAINARDAMTSGGTLRVATHIEHLDERGARKYPNVAPGSHVILTVSDTGCGMDVVTRERAFEPFFTTKPAGQGSGLGLSTVYCIVSRWGGHVSLDSAAGTGTRVFIRLRRAQGPFAAQNVGAGPSRSVARKRTSVLVVEDDRLVRTSIRHFLRSAGYDVLEARDGQEGLAMYSTHADEVSVVVTDIALPKLCGTDLARLLRERDPDVRIILMSAHLPRNGRLDTPPMYLQKPFSREQLVEAVAGAIE